MIPIGGEQLNPGAGRSKIAERPICKSNGGSSRITESTPSANTVEKTSRDHYYPSLLASTTVAPRLPSKIPAKVSESSADAIYNAYPDQGPGFYRYVERDSRSRSIAAN